MNHSNKIVAIFNIPLKLYCPVQGAYALKLCTYILVYL